MKKRLLLVAVSVLSCLGMQAGSWVEPTLPTTGSEPVSGRIYQIKNVEADMSLCGAATWHSWNTSAALSEADPLTFTLTKEEKGWTIARTTDGKFTFISNANVAGMTGVGEMHVDMGTQGHNYFEFVPQANSTYHIRAAASDDLYGTSMAGYDVKCWGWEKGENPINPIAVYGTVEPGEQFACDWIFLDMTMYNARKALYDALVSSEAYPSVTITSYEAVYNNADATLEAVKQAADALTTAIMQAKAYEVLDGATEDSPRDATSLLKNPDFASSNADGWDMTFKGGENATNVGFQSASYSNGEATISGFIEAWSNATTFNKNVTFRALGDGQLSQTLKGLPAGKYKLTGTFVAVCQDASGANKDAKLDANGNPLQGVELFAKGGELDIFSNIATGDGKPEIIELFFISTGGDITLGLRTKNATANWIAGDNFTLEYYGPVQEDPLKILLQSYVNEVEAKYAQDNLEDLKAYTETKAAYDVAMTAAKAGLENGSDDYTTLQNNLKAAYDALAVSVKEYQGVEDQLEVYLDKMTQASQKKEWGDLAGDLEEKRMALYEQYDNCALNSEQIAAISTDMTNIIGTFISENCKDGDDVTILLNNPAFNKNFSGWATTGSAPIWAANHAQGANVSDYAMNVEASAKPLENDGLAEKWHAKFTMTQTIKNMPRGLYTLSCQGFNRHDDNEIQSAQLYAILPDGSIPTADFASIDDYATDQPLYQVKNADGNLEWFSDADRNGKWAPNGMTGSAWHFMHKSDGVNFDYESKIDIVLKENGDLTLGARCEYEHQWVIFDNFRIIYRGAGPKVFEGSINDAIAKGNKAIEGFRNASDHNPVGISVKVDNDWNELVGRAEDVRDNATTTDECIAILSELEAGIKAINASGNLLIDLQKKVNYISEIRMLTTGTSTELETMVDEVVNALDGMEVQTDDAAKQMLSQLDVLVSKAALTTLLASAGEVTESNPLVCTGVIDNPNAFFEEQNSTFAWTMQGNAVAGEKAFEIFGQEEASMTQMVGLVPGYYNLKVNGFYRNGLPADVAKARNGETAEDGTPLTDEAGVMLFAGDAETKLLNIFDGVTAYNNKDAREVAVTGAEITVNETKYLVPNNMAEASQAFKEGLYQNVLQFQVTDAQGVKGMRKAPVASETEGVKVGIRKIKEAYKPNDWVIVSNFVLEYLGTDAPAVDPTTTPTTTDVEGVEAAVAPTTYFTVTGVRQHGLQKGINILRMPNGKVVKVLVK